MIVFYKRHLIGLRSVIDVYKLLLKLICKQCDFLFYFLDVLDQDS